MKELENGGQCAKAHDGESGVGLFSRQGGQRSHQGRAAAPGSCFSTVLSPMSSSLGIMGSKRPAAEL